MEVICGKKPVDEIPVCGTNNHCGDNCDIRA